MSSKQRVKPLKPEDTEVILKNFAIIFPAFYVTYYIMIAILCAIASVPVNGLEPFDHANFNPGEGGRSLVTWLSFVLMLFVGVVLIYFVVRSTPMAWDYAVTFTFVHFILSCLITVSFPVNWVWWVTVIIGTFLLSTGAEMSCYYLRDMRSIKVDHE